MSLLFRRSRVLFFHLQVFVVCCGLCRGKGCARHEVPFHVVARTEQAAQLPCSCKLWNQASNTSTPTLQNSLYPSEIRDLISCNLVRSYRQTLAEAFLLLLVATDGTPRLLSASPNPSDADISSLPSSRRFLMVNQHCARDPRDLRAICAARRVGSVRQMRAHVPDGPWAPGTQCGDLCAGHELNVKTLAPEHGTARALLVSLRARSL